jgi:hypothetical protein
MPERAPAAFAPAHPLLVVIPRPLLLRMQACPAAGWASHSCRHCGLLVCVLHSRHPALPRHTPSNGAARRATPAPALVYSSRRPPACPPLRRRPLTLGRAPPGPAPRGGAAPPSPRWRAPSGPAQPGQGSLLAHPTPFLYPRGRKKLLRLPRVFSMISVGAKKRSNCSVRSLSRRSCAPLGARGASRRLSSVVVAAADDLLARGVEVDGVLVLRRVAAPAVTERGVRVHHAWGGGAGQGRGDEAGFACARREGTAHGRADRSAAYPGTGEGSRRAASKFAVA